MKAAVFDGKRVVCVADRPQPRPAAGEVLVRVLKAGLCSTDLEIVKGYMGFTGVMGHEFVGMVVDGPARWLGCRVAAEICCVCGRCDMCTGGLKNHCRSRSVLGIDARDGVFAEYVAIPEMNLHEVPDAVDDEAAVFIEPLAAAYQLVRQIRFDVSQRIVVLGDGRLGQLCARVVKTICPDLLLVGKHPEKLQAAERCGLRTALIDEYRPAATADVVIEATGAAAGLETAMAAVRPRGTLAIKSTFAGGEPLNLTPLAINEITVVGSRCGPFPDAIAALARGEIDVGPLISARLPLERISQALDLAAGGAMKVILDVV